MATWLLIFFPAILPIAPAAGIAGLSMLASMVGLTYRYRHEFKFKRVIPPFIIYAAVATWSVHLSSVLDTNVMRMMLGGLLIALYLYFTLVKNSDSRQFPWYVAIGFMIISGFFNGLLGIGGPLMALYFLSLSKSIPEYTANIQGFFLIDAFYINSVRVANGILVPHDVPYIWLLLELEPSLRPELRTNLMIKRLESGFTALLGLVGFIICFFNVCKVDFKRRTV
ncbi:sulfite exporter TauE/SafE family protein [Pediococcus inopinatus]|uniref:sulfite exporter TauE/SafE family protein n=1 Tax=Pediococcus inopinatus TaxID=114090 RepID=UPI002B25B79C|nr:sulfite exporter TauE/SafE family protein [Pediococcus inopinatus]WPC16666.1 sulfite exporter TauE/SafE family protein [Pediococcus inopinatus]